MKTSSASTALRRTALACVAAMAIVVVASALLRHLGASASLQAAWAGELALARQTHRVAATLALLGALGLVLLSRGAPAQAVLARGLFALGLLLSVVGVVGGASRAAPVVLVNLLGGLAMLALSVRLAAADARAGLGRPAAIVLGLVALQAALGALAGLQASADCIALQDCGAAALLHRIAGTMLALALIVLGLWASRRHGRRSGRVLVAAGFALLLLGSVAAGLGSTTVPLLIVLHNALGAAAVAALARLV